MAGIAAEVLPKIALNWAMIKAAPEQGSAVLGKPAMANINLAHAIPAINTPARAPATPAAQAPPAVVNILNVIVHHLILGHQGLVLAPQLINTSVPAPVIPVAPAPPAVANIRLAPVPAAMSGMVAAARNKSSMAPKETFTIATARWLVLRLAA